MVSREFSSTQHIKENILSLWRRRKNVEKKKCGEEKTKNLISLEVCLRIFLFCGLLNM